MNKRWNGSLLMVGGWQGARERERSVESLCSIPVHLRYETSQYSLPHVIKRKIIKRPVKSTEFFV